MKIITIVLSDGEQGTAGGCCCCRVVVVILLYCAHRTLLTGVYSPSISNTSVTDNRMANIAPCIVRAFHPPFLPTSVHTYYCVLCSTTWLYAYFALYKCPRLAVIIFIFFHVFYRICCTLFINSLRTSVPGT